MSGDSFLCEVMNWQLFAELSEKVANNIIASGWQPDFLVGLARGGWVLSRVLCDFLGVKDIVSLKVEHWGITATPNGKARIKYPFEVDLTGRRVLVVDDITDTGESMMIAMKYVKEKNPLEVKTATLRHIEGSKFTPDYYGDVITWRWVIFPWNYVEDMVNLVPKACEDGSSPEDIKKAMREKFSIDVPEKHIEKALTEIKRRKTMI